MPVNDTSVNLKENQRSRWLLSDTDILPPPLSVKPPEVALLEARLEALERKMADSCLPTLPEKAAESCSTAEDVVAHAGNDPMVLKKLLTNWIDSAAMFNRNSDYWRGRAEKSEDRVEEKIIEFSDLLVFDYGKKKVRDHVFIHVYIYNLMDEFLSKMGH